MKTKLIALLFAAGTSMFAATHVYFGARIGYAPAPVVVYAGPPVAPISAYVAPAPGPGYTWVGGYWYPAGARWSWRAGYWTRPPYARATWVAPRYYGGRYFAGRWR